MKRILGLLLLLGGSALFGWEVNTHRAIDHWAISRYQGSQNLHYFAESVGIKNESYYDQKIDDYVLPDGTKNITYFDYVTKGEPYTISAWNQDFDSYYYSDLIEAGTILEDSLWPGITKNVTAPILGVSDKDSAAGRFNFHFYDAYTRKGLSNIPGEKNTQENHYANSSAVEWVFENRELYLFNPFNLGAEEHDNSYNYDSALEYFEKGFTESTPKVRKSYRAKMFVSIGFMLHMVNDMSVPAHVRNDAHAPDDFEKWMREGDKKGYGGFRIKGTTTDFKSSYELIKLIRSIPARKYSTKKDFMIQEADYIGKHFFSEDSIDVSGKYQLQDNITVPKEMSGKYIVSNYGKLAKRTYTIVPVGQTLTAIPMDIIDEEVIKDNAKVIIPRAIANAEGFINYFFRGRLQATLIDGNLIIKNVSDPSLVASADIVKFSDNTYKVYYETDNNETYLLQDCTAPNALDVNESFECDISQKLEDKKNEIGKAQKLTVIYDGIIGNEKGVSVAIAKKFTNADLLFSFDKSGSMGSDIENAKNSAKDILDNIIGIENNSTFIEVEAFNSSAGVLFAYENNVTKAKNAISTIYSWGGTALYDAIKLAGDNAVTHKASSGISKSIVILYTDGQENSSAISRQQAIDAISNAKASSIDEVFLIFVGNDTNGKAKLKAIADKAGREFMSVSNASGLKDAIEKILKGQ